MAASISDNELALFIQTLARDIRGQIINIFTVTEVVIDDIIRKTTFDNEAQFDTYMDIFNKGEMTMNVKKKLLKMCVDKFEKKHNQDLSKLKEQIDNVVDKRNKLAHWVVDTSLEGLALYKDKKKIRLFSIDKNRNRTDVYFDFDSTKELEANIYQITTTLITMQKTIDQTLGK